MRTSLATCGSFSFAVGAGLLRPDSGGRVASGRSPADGPFGSHLARRNPDPGRGRLVADLLRGQHGIAALSPNFFTARQTLTDLDGQLRRHVVEVLVVDLDGRGAVARGKALGRFERKLSIGRRPAGLYAEMFLEGRDELARPTVGARDVATHRHEVFALRFLLEHGVEARGGENLSRGQAEKAGHLPHSGLRHVTLNGLDQEQQRQNGRSFVGVSRYEALGDVAKVVVENGGLRSVAVCHRSTPPRMGSIDAIDAVRSATSCPLTIVGSACRFTNEGSRTCTR